MSQSGEFPQFHPSEYPNKPAGNNEVPFKWSTPDLEGLVSGKEYAEILNRPMQPGQPPREQTSVPGPGVKPVPLSNKAEQQVQTFFMIPRKPMMTRTGLPSAAETSTGVLSGDVTPVKAAERGDPQPGGDTDTRVQQRITVRRERARAAIARDFGIETSAAKRDPLHRLGQISDISNRWFPEVAGGVQLHPAEFIPVPSSSTETANSHPSVPQSLTGVITIPSYLQRQTATSLDTHELQVARAGISMQGTDDQVSVSEANVSDEEAQGSAAPVMPTILSEQGVLGQSTQEDEDKAGRTSTPPSHISTHVLVHTGIPVSQTESAAPVQMPTPHTVAPAGGGVGPTQEKKRTPEDIKKDYEAAREAAATLIAKQELGFSTRKRDLKAREDVLDTFQKALIEYAASAESDVGEQLNLVQAEQIEFAKRLLEIKEAEALRNRQRGGWHAILSNKWCVTLGTIAIGTGIGAASAFIGHQYNADPTTMFGLIRYVGTALVSGVTGFIGGDAAVRASISNGPQVPESKQRADADASKNEEYRVAAEQFNRPVQEIVEKGPAALADDVTQAATAVTDLIDQRAKNVVRQNQTDLWWGRVLGSLGMIASSMLVESAADTTFLHQLAQQHSTAVTHTPPQATPVHAPTPSPTHTPTPTTTPSHPSTPTPTRTQQPGGGTEVGSGIANHLPSAATIPHNAINHLPADAAQYLDPKDPMNAVRWAVSHSNGHYRLVDVGKTQQVYIYAQGHWRALNSQDEFRVFNKLMGNAWRMRELLY